MGRLFLGFIQTRDGYTAIHLRNLMPSTGADMLTVTDFEAACVQYLNNLYTAEKGPFCIHRIEQNDIYEY